MMLRAEYLDSTGHLAPEITSISRSRRPFRRKCVVAKSRNQVILNTMTVLESIVEELKTLPADKLEVAANVIHALSFEAQNEEIHPEWLEELDRRDEEIEDGTVKSVSAEQVESYVMEKLAGARRISS